METLIECILLYQNGLMSIIREQSWFLCLCAFPRYFFNMYLRPIFQKGLGVSCLKKRALLEFISTHCEYIRPGNRATLGLLRTYFCYCRIVGLIPVLFSPKRITGSSFAIYYSVLKIFQKNAVSELPIKKIDIHCKEALPWKL